MTQTDLDATKPPPRKRVHRMMRRAVILARYREHRRLAGEAAIKLGNVPFWRVGRRRDLEDEMTWHGDKARLLAEVLGMGVPNGATMPDVAPGGIGIRGGAVKGQEGGKA